MQQYQELMQKVLKEGVDKTDRTGTGTKSIFGHQMRFDLSKGFPLVTTKKIHTKSVIHELLWFLSGSTNTQYLTDNGVRIWNEWADENGDLGRVYGAQWRSWQKPDGTFIDQISKVIEDLRDNPNSRRHIVVAYNPGELDQMALPPCHAFFQFYVANNKLSCQLYQRSVDIFLGLPFNIASYALLVEMIAKTLDYEVGEFIHTSGDAHIYNDHLNQVNLQVTRECRELPSISFEKKDSIFEYKYEDFTIENYNPHPLIKGKVSI